MQLITRSFTFYSVLLFLWESAVALGWNKKLNACEKAVDNLFSLVESNHPKSDFFFNDFYFIADKNLIKMFYTESSLAPEVKKGKLQREPDQKIVVNDYEFVSDDTIEFTVKHPDEEDSMGRKNPKYSVETRGKAQIVCTEDACKNAIKEVKKHQSWRDNKKLRCLKNRDGPYISGSFRKGVAITLPWRQSYLIFDAKNILKFLINTEDPVPYRWEATFVVLQDDVVTYQPKSGDLIAVPLPPPVTEATRDYFNAVVDFFVWKETDKSRSQSISNDDLLIFDQIPKASLPATVNARTSEDDTQLSPASQRSIKKHQN